MDLSAAAQFLCGITLWSVGGDGWRNAISFGLGLDNLDVLPLSFGCQFNGFAGQ